MHTGIDLAQTSSSTKYLFVYEVLKCTDLPVIVSGLRIGKQSYAGSHLAKNRELHGYIVKISIVEILLVHPVAIQGVMSRHTEVENKGKRIEPGVGCRIAGIHLLASSDTIAYPSMLRSTEGLIGTQAVIRTSYGEWIHCWQK